MVYYPDLRTDAMIDSGDHIRAIGWLTDAHPFPTGSVSEAFVEKLRKFTDLHWESTESMGWPIHMGAHECELCNDFMAIGNIAIPTAEVLYVAPEMISHYVEVHHYSPPQEFVDAVLASPLTGSDEFNAAIAKYRELHTIRMRLFISAMAANESGGTEEAIRAVAMKQYGEASDATCEAIRKLVSQFQSM